jgi:exonuclease SbcC
MPYRDNVPTLDFTGMHTVSICGDNGNGKSAIIDAMTWALWGETRAKRDDDIIHQNQDETEVEFEFVVGGQNYRIIRKHARPKGRRTSGQSSLHFQIANDNGFRALDGDSKQQTQQKIIDVLHMDYNTFINSAYLRQGHADEFTTATPAKRKQVLANILGLSYYDDIKAFARELASQKKMAKEQLLFSITEIDKELAQKPASELEILEAQGKLEQIEESIKTHDVLLIDLRKQKELLESKRAQLNQLDSNLSERRKTLLQWQEHIGRLHTRVTEYETLINRREEIEGGYKSFIGAKELNDKLNKNLTLVSRLNQRKHELEMLIERESQTLTKDHALAQNKINELEKTASELPALKEELKKTQLLLQSLTARDKALQDKKELRQEIIAQIRSAESDKSRLEKEINEINEKLSLLIAQPDKAKCPVCNTELGEAGLKHISAHYDSEKQEKSLAIKSGLSVLANKNNELKTIEAEIKLFEESFTRDRTKAQNQSGALEREITRAEQADNQLKEELDNVKLIEERLTGKNFALPQQETLRQIVNELGNINYDTQKHEQARQQLDSLQKYEAPKLKLEEADRLINQDKEDIARTEKAITELQTGLKIDEEHRQTLSSEIIVLPELTNNLQLAESEYRRLTAEQKLAQQNIGNITGKLEYFARREIERSEKEQQLNLSVKELSIYQDLAEAFSEKGIQALLIETALPEIEIESNRLLSRMTDNRMHVKIETQRETQKGDVIETLEIKISDELGTRNYEMFSGGEAFRINFAIRIALSRLLARRAGAPLPTLIIDEGFGTQDASGIEKLREAINSVQDDFEKILVITHVEELRDAFPARIDVIKTADGSTISLN